MKQIEIVWPEDDGCPEYLMDMRYVYLNEKHFDRTPSQKAMRDVLESGKSAFVKMMTQFERDWAKEKADKGAVVGADAGTEKCLQMVEELLARLEGA